MTKLKTEYGTFVVGVKNDRDLLGLLFDAQPLDTITDEDIHAMFSRIIKPPHQDLVKYIRDKITRTLNEEKETICSRRLQSVAKASLFDHQNPSLFE